MNPRRGYIVTATGWLKAALGAAAVFVAACGEEPIPEREPAWTVVADFPAGYHPVALSSDDFIVAYSDAGYTIFTYEMGEFVPVYDTQGQPIRLTDVDGGTGYNSGCYACGAWMEGDTPKPYLLHLGADGWTPVALSGVGEGYFSAVRVTGPEAGWLLLNRYYEIGDDYGRLVRFEGNAAKTYGEFGDVTFTCASGHHIPWPGITYAVTYPGDYGRYGPDGARVFASEDGGASWTTERLPANLFGARTVLSARAAATRGAELYIIAELEGDAFGIAKRTGAPGAGVYEPVFYAPLGPYFTEIRHLAFRLRAKPFGFSCDGVAVGENTTVVFDDETWTLEKTDFPIVFRDVTDLEAPGFWALASSYYVGAKLLYHP